MTYRALVVSTLLAVAACEAEAEDDGPPSLTGDLYALRYGPILVPPGKEDTRCVKRRLSNTDPIKVHQLRNLLSDGSHHLIVYKDDDPASVETEAPYECTPFTGALNLDGL